MPVSAVVLIHSPLVGPLTWRAVAAELDRAGYATVVADHRGWHDAAGIAAAVAAQVPADVTQTVLIGHSGAGPLLPLIADAIGTTTAVVYVDAGLPRPGVSWVEDAPAPLVEQLRSTVDEVGVLPRWHEWFPPDAIGPLDPAFTDEIPQLPWTYFTEALPAARWTGPRSYVLLSEAYRDQAELVRAAAEPVVELAAGHLAPVRCPVEVAAALREVLDRPRAGLPFGSTASTYDQVRPAYPDELVARILADAGHPVSAVEVGAGTGKASEAFAARGIRLTCVEPDPEMVAVLRSRFADRPHVTVVRSRFEDWTPPPERVELLVFALSWHWVDPLRRARLAAAALRPGGVLALLYHIHGFADPDLKARLDRIYDEVAPHLRARPEQVSADVIAGHTRDLMESGLFTDVNAADVTHDHPYPTDRYMSLLGTFSSHLALAPARRQILHERIRAAVDEAGGAVVLRLDSSMVLGRRAG